MKKLPNYITLDLEIYISRKIHSGSGPTDKRMTNRYSFKNKSTNIEQPCVFRIYETRF